MADIKDSYVVLKCSECGGSFGIEDEKSFDADFIEVANGNIVFISSANNKIRTCPSCGTQFEHMRRFEKASGGSIGNVVSSQGVSGNNNVVSNIVFNGSVKNTNVFIGNNNKHG